MAWGRDVEGLDAMDVTESALLIRGSKRDCEMSLGSRYFIWPPKCLGIRPLIQRKDQLWFHVPGGKH